MMKPISEFFYRLTKTPLMPATRHEYLKQEVFKTAKLVIELGGLINMYKCQKADSFEILDLLVDMHRRAIKDWKSIAEKLDSYKTTESISKCEK